MKQFIRVMKALSDPNRVKAMAMLQERSLCVCEIQAALGLAQPTVSSHLKVLEEAGLIEGFRAAQWMNYALARDMDPVGRVILDHLRQWVGDDPEVAALVDRVPGLNRETICTALRPGKDPKERYLMNGKMKVLFICTHNSARSQMAEAYMNSLAGDRFAAESAGFEPHPINPLVVEAMAEEGLDISQNKSKSVFGLFKAGRVYDYVVTVCEDAKEGQCPIFPGVTRRIHIPFVDPAALTGGHAEKMVQVRAIRDAIKKTVLESIAEWDANPAPRKLG